LLPSQTGRTHIPSFPGANFVEVAVLNIQQATSREIGRLKLQMDEDDKANLRNEGMDIGIKMRHDVACVYLTDPHTELGQTRLFR